MPFGAEAADVDHVRQLSYQRVRCFDIECQRGGVPMSVINYLTDHDLPLIGSSISQADAEQLLSKLYRGVALETYVDLLQSFPLCGAAFSLCEEHDLSGYGAEVQWMNTTQMLSEALETYPGIVVSNIGYIPVGMCLSGSGDYYYLNAKAGDPSNPPLVRVPSRGHDIGDNLRGGAD